MLVGEASLDHFEQLPRGGSNFLKIVKVAHTLVSEILSQQFAVADDCIYRRAQVVAQSCERLLSF